MLADITLSRSRNVDPKVLFVDLSDFQNLFLTNFTSCQIQSLERMATIRDSRICWVLKQMEHIDPLSRKPPRRPKLFPSAQVFNTSRTLTSCFNVMNAASGGYSIANSSLLGKSVLISRQACKMFLLHAVLNCKT